MAEEKKNKALRDEYDTAMNRARKTMKKVEPWSGKKEDFYHWKTKFLMMERRTGRYFTEGSMNLEAMTVDNDAAMRKLTIVYEGESDMWREIGQSFLGLLPKQYAQMALQQPKLDRATVLHSVNVDHDHEDAANDLVPEMSDYPHPHIMFKFICKQMEEMTRSEKHSLIQELGKIKCKGLSVAHLEEFISKIIEICDRLAIIQLEPNEEYKLTTLLAGIPHKFGALKRLLEQNEKNWDECIELLRTEFRDNELEYTEYKARKEEAKDKKSKAKDDNILAVELSSQECYKCGETGHYARECTHASSSRQNRGRGRNRGNNRGRGQGRSQNDRQRCNICNHYHKGKCWYEDKEKAKKEQKANVLQSRSNQLESESSDDENDLNENHAPKPPAQRGFVLSLSIMKQSQSQQISKKRRYQADDAADVHATGDLSQLVDVKTIQPIDVGGFSTDAPRTVCTKVGRLDLIAIVGGETVEVSIENVHYLPTMKPYMTLISEGQMANRGTRRVGDARQSPYERDLVHKFMQGNDVVMEAIQKKGSARSYLQVYLASTPHIKPTLLATRVQPEEQTSVGLVGNPGQVKTHSMKDSCVAFGCDLLKGSSQKTEQPVNTETKAIVPFKPVEKKDSESKPDEPKPQERSQMNRNHKSRSQSISNLHKTIANTLWVIMSSLKPSVLRIVQ